MAPDEPPWPQTNPICGNGIVANSARRLQIRNVSHAGHQKAADVVAEMERQRHELQQERQEGEAALSAELEQRQQRIEQLESEANRRLSDG